MRNWCKGGGRMLSAYALKEAIDEGEGFGWCADCRRYVPVRGKLLGRHTIKRDMKGPAELAGRFR